MSDPTPTVTLPPVTITAKRELPPPSVLGDPVDGGNLFGRKVSLLLLPSPMPKQVTNNASAYTAQPTPSDPLDLSELHIIFSTRQDDAESPNNCQIRVHNLAPETVVKIKKEFGRVVLQAGYEGGYFGVIFDGTIKQWREGRESNKVDTYLDILAADGDLAYNYGTCNTSLPAGSTPQQRTTAVLQAISSTTGCKPGQTIFPQTFGGTLPRGRVLFGLGRTLMRAQTQNIGATWNINQNQINVVPLKSYLPGEAVVLNAHTGLIGRPEETIDGIKARCLINPKIQVGGLVQIDNASINQTDQQKNFTIPGAQLPYDKWVGLQLIARTSADGLYRVYVAEYNGDTRGTPWYMDLILLAVDPITKEVQRGSA